MKRVISLLLTLLMIINILPLQAFAGESEAYFDPSVIEETDEDIFDDIPEEDIPDTKVPDAQQVAAIQPIVEKMINDYAREVYQPNAGSDAIDQLGMRAIYGKGKDLKLNKTSPTTAAVFNTNLFKIGITKAITTAIIAMQDRSLSYLYVLGSFAWNSYDNRYNVNMYSEKGNSASRVYYGTSESYTGPLTRNDAALKYCIGGMNAWIDVTLKSQSNNVATYGIKIKIADTYNFDGDYDKAESEGFNTNLEEFLTGFGGLIDGKLIQSFDWEFTTEELVIETPVFYNCNHLSSSYRWEYDVETNLLSTAYSTDTYENKITQYTYAGSSGKENIYYELADPIKLLHNKPWEIEWKMVNQVIALSPTDRSDSTYEGHIYQTNRNRVLFRLNTAKKDVDDKYVRIRDDYGLPEEKYKYYSKHEYIYNLKNVITDNGTNTIWLTVYDVTDDAVVGEYPLIYHYAYDENKKYVITHVDETCAYNQDFEINFLGSKYNNVIAKSDYWLEIYENGKENAGVKSSFVPVTQPATCDKQGYEGRVCTECGYVDAQKYLDKLPHTFGQYKYDNNATCTEDGTLTAICKVCGEKDTVIAENTATGHTEAVDEAVAPTCTTIGFTEGSHCSVCDEIIVMQEIVPTTDHIFENYTLNGDGTKTAQCNTCDTMQTINDAVYDGEGWFIDSNNILRVLADIPDNPEWLQYSNIVEKILLPENLTYIGENAFSGFRKVDSLVIPDTVEYIASSAFEDFSNTAQIIIINNSYAVDVLKSLNVISPLLDNMSISLDKEYIILKKEESADITVNLPYPAEVTWTSDSDIVTLESNGTSCKITAEENGVAYITASVTYGEKTITAKCRVNVTDISVAELINGAHTDAKTVTSKIYSTDYATVDIHFDMLQLMSTMDADTPQLTDNGVSMMYAYFTDDTASQLYNLIVKDDRTLIIVPDLKYNDIKDFKTECKSTITVCVDFEEFETVETVTIKADKTLPTVKSTAVKLNSFYTNDTMPLVLTSNKGAVISAQLDETKTNPDWLILNEDMTVTLKEGITGKASGKLYLDVYVANYAQPVKVAVSVSVANTPPKLKLSSTKATFYTFRDNATATTIYLQSNDKKVFFNDIGVTDIKVADISLMTSKDAKTYVANNNYTVTSYDKETGMFTLDVLNEAVSGKVLMEVSIEGSDQTVKLPITVTAYNKAPTFKLSKSSVTINTAYAPAGSTAKVDVIATPADYAVTNDNFSWVVTDSKNNPVENVLDVSFEKGTITIKSNENTVANGKYKVVFTLDGVAKPVTLNVTVKPVTMKVSKTSVTLNKLADDSATVTLTTTPADYILSEENLTYTVTDSKNNPVDAVDVEFDFSDMKAGKFVKLSVNENSTYGATYKVNFTLKETGKTTIVTVKTLAENKSVIKLSVSAKGKLETGYLTKGVTITPKWTNLMQSVDISENIRVYATAKTKGAVPVDVTECFNILATNGTYLLTFKDTDSMKALNPKDKYTVVCEDVTVKGQNVDDTKAVTITFAVTKAKVTQNVKSVNLYLNDRYSRGEFKLTLADKTMPDISAVEIADAKMAEFYQLIDLGGGKYAIEFKDNQIADKLKAGNIKLNIYLDGNTPVYKTPNASVSVKVNAVKFKTK